MTRMEEDEHGVLGYEVGGMMDGYGGWRAEHTASAGTIEHLVDAFHRIVYPM